MIKYYLSLKDTLILLEVLFQIYFYWKCMIFDIQQFFRYLTPSFYFLILFSKCFPALYTSL